MLQRREKQHRGRGSTGRTKGCGVHVHLDELYEIKDFHTLPGLPFPLILPGDAKTR